MGRLEASRSRLGLHLGLGAQDGCKNRSNTGRKRARIGFWQGTRTRASDRRVLPAREVSDPAFDGRPLEDANSNFGAESVCGRLFFN